jgi:hypothetical protein
MPVHDEHSTETHACEKNLKSVAHHCGKHFLSIIGARHGVLRKIHSLYEGFKAIFQSPCSMGRVLPVASALGIYLLLRVC